MEKNSAAITMGLIILLGGCLAGPIPDEQSTGDSNDGGDSTAGSAGCHGLLIADHPHTEPDETVPLSNGTIQSAEPVVTVIEQFRRNGNRQQMGVDGDSANATRDALRQFERGPGSLVAHVRLDSRTTVSVSLTWNGSLCGPTP